MIGMQVVFRADASLQIGTGHVMRCLTLADALQARGATCRFVCRAHEGNLIALIRERGYEAVTLPRCAEVAVPRSDEVLPAHAAWLACDWKTDAAQTRAALKGECTDWMVVDHYALDARWERALRSGYRRLMVIDDLADREHDCDLLLDQNLGRDVRDYAGRVAARCKVMVGPRHALLRPGFAALREESLARRAQPVMRRLMVSMGGVDRDNATGEVLSALQQCQLPDDTNVTVVMGPSAPWLDAVRAKARSSRWSVDVRTNVADMAPLMASSDLAIGAAGSTSWERCSLGLPTLMVVLADNQREAAAALAHAGAAVMIDGAERISEVLPREISRLAEDSDALRSLSGSAAAVCDGLGVHRVADHLVAALENANGI